MVMLHDKKYFYKYVTAETALLILQKRKLKYSSPAIFNDPFDTQTKVGFDFEESEFMEVFADELYGFFHDEKEPTLTNAVPLSKDIQAKRQIVKNSHRRMPKDVFKLETKTLIEDSAIMFKQYIDDMNTWWRQVVKASRVFCVAEEHDNLLMWAHYTKDHKGAVIEFECLPELDTPLCVAKKIKYVTKPPLIARQNEYIRYITRQDSYTLNHELSVDDLFLSKSKHWEYEQEWRVFIPPVNMENPAIPKDVDGNDILFDLLPFYPQEIYSIYLGCKMSDENRQKIKMCLTGDFKHVKKYKCIRSEKKYDLDFEEII